MTEYDRKSHAPHRACTVWAGSTRTPEPGTQLSEVRLETRQVPTATLIYVCVTAGCDVCSLSPSLRYDCNTNSCAIAECRPSVREPR